MASLQNICFTYYGSHLDNQFHRLISRVISMRGVTGEFFNKHKILIKESKVDDNLFIIKLQYAIY